MEADHLKQVVVRIVKGQPQAGLGAVDVHAVEVHDVVVGELAQQHDLADRSRANALAFLEGASLHACMESVFSGTAA